MYSAWNKMSKHIGLEKNGVLAIKQIKKLSLTY